MQHSISNYFRLTITLSICIVFTFSLIWPERRPRLMGEQIPFKVLMPNRKRIQRKIVFYHNYFRSRVTPPASNMLRMKWHKGVAKAAQSWAQKCAFLIHDNITGRYIDSYGVCGQNIFVATHKVPWLFAIKTWYLEKDNFTYGSRNNNLKEVGHYVQMVWASTHEVGCGLAICHRSLSANNTIQRVYYNYVCNYCPIGNRQNRTARPYRRGKPCSSCRNYCHKKKLCTNSCPTADLWANCREIYKAWPSWLCSSYTVHGKNRSSSCGATCLCSGKIHD